MEELIVVAVLCVLAGSLGGGSWRRARRRDSDQVGDAVSTVTAGPDGTMTVVVANPGTEPVVVSACARPSGRFRRLGRGQVRRGRNPQERSNPSRAVRQLLGSVPPGGETTWHVVGDASTRPVCRVVLSVYQARGRVRVHESMVRTVPGSVEVGITRRRPLARPQYDAGH